MNTTTEDLKLSPIGIFDSGYGGLTVMREIIQKMPQYDYLYLGDNARAPYGTRSFETIYEYTLQCVKYLFSKGCPLVILACNTASAKALRSIQQKDLPILAPENRVLGVIRPTAEIIGNYSKSGYIGVLGTNGTIQSRSYVLEIEKFFPHIHVYQEACPMWVPLVENGEYESEGALYFVKKNIHNILQKSPQIDTLLLGCTHYPLLLKTIQKIVPPYINVLSQGEIVAKSLENYLQRHPEMAMRCTKNQTLTFHTTDSATIFDEQAKVFLGKTIQSVHVHL